jgi:8-oxo-dGTP pyrophosphatase MutT (NUDIX family)
MTDPLPTGSGAMPAVNGELMAARGNGQDWLVAWYPADARLSGVPHGAAGICIDADSNLVLISHDGEHWGFPAGRPEGNETPEDTLRREMLEEACVTVTSARLLGFARSECIEGFQRGTVLVRSFWQADVRIEPWLPEFEIQHCRIIPVTAAKRHVTDPDHAATRISFRALAEAGIS